MEQKYINIVDLVEDFQLVSSEQIVLLFNKYSLLLAKVGVDTAENEPLMNEHCPAAEPEGAAASVRLLLRRRRPPLLCKLEAEQSKGAAPAVWRSTTARVRESYLLAKTAS